MSTQMVRQTMFTTGEVDVNVWKRTDIEHYLQAAQALTNMEVGITGLAKKRKGTKSLFISTEYVDPNSQMYEFVDQNQNYYLICSNATKDDPAFLTWNVFHIDATTGAITPVNMVTYGSSIFQKSSPTTPLPYSSAELKDVDFSQDNDSLVLTHPAHPTLRIYINSYLDPLEPIFVWEYLAIYPPPAFDFNTINYNAAAATFTNPTATTFRLVLTGLGTQFSSAWVNGQIVSSGSSPDSPIGYGIITSYTNAAGNAQFDGTVYVAFAAPADMPTVGNGYSVRQPAWSATLGYPAKVTFYQNRLWVANTLALPGSVFGSKINQPVSFDVGTGRDTDAIIYNVGQSNSGDILWLNGGKQLEIYSENFEFVAPQEQNLALTPSTFSIRQQSAYGSSVNIKPTTYINDSYYVTRTKNAIINFHFTGIGQAYISSNISLVSQHLVKDPQSRALLRGTDVSQDNFVYYLNADSSVTAFQFASEYKLAALTPVNFGQEVIVKDICTINNKVYFLKSYDDVTEGAIQTFEVFDPTTKMDGYIEATLAANNNITGLEQFNGYTVQVTFNDSEGRVNDLGLHQVSGGFINVAADNTNGFMGTVKVGLLYDVLLRPMYITPGSTMYSSASKRTYDFKNINRIYIDYVDSLNFYVNGTLVQYQYFNLPTDTEYHAPTPQTDTAEISIANGWDRFSTFDITQSSPFDLQITGIAYQMEAHII